MDPYDSLKVPFCSPNNPDNPKPTLKPEGPECQSGPGGPGALLRARKHQGCMVPLRVPLRVLSRVL